MKRKAVFEQTSYWQVQDVPASNSNFFEELTYEELWPEELSSVLLSILKEFDQVVLKLTKDENLIFESLDKVFLYQLTVPDARKNSLFRRLIDYGDENTFLIFEKKEMSGKKYNDLVFKEQRGSSENLLFLDQDCPKCNHLLEEPRYKNEEEPQIITCSNYECKYIDDLETDYSCNEKHFKATLKELKKDGYMEITGITKQEFLEKTKPEEQHKSCKDCSLGVIQVENVFVKKEYGKLLHLWLNKCHRCHRFSTTRELSPQDPIAIASMGILESFQEEE